MSCRTPYVFVFGWARGSGQLHVQAPAELAFWTCRQTSNPTTTPRSPSVSTTTAAADRQQGDFAAAAASKLGSTSESAVGAIDPRFRRGSASALAIAAAAEAAQAGMHMRMVPSHSQQAAPSGHHSQQGIWPGSRPSLLPTSSHDSAQQQQQRYQQRPSMIPRQGWSR